MRLIWHTTLLGSFLVFAEAKQALAQPPDPTNVQSQTLSGFPETIHDQVELRKQSENAASKTILDTDPATIAGPVEQGVLRLLRGIHFLQENRMEEAKNELSLAEQLIPKESQLSPVLHMFVIEATLPHLKPMAAMQKLKSLMQQYKTFGDWRAEQYRLMLKILTVAKTDRVLAKTWTDYEAKVRPAQRRDDVSQLIIDYLEKQNKTPTQEWVAVLESMASLYPYSETSRWAFQKLQSLNCLKKTKAPRYVTSQWLLSRWASNSVLDEGLRQYVAAATEVPVRTGANEVKYLDTSERISFLIQLRFYREALDLATEELAGLPPKSQPATMTKRARVLSQLGQIQIKMNDWVGAARTFSLYLDEFSTQVDSRFALENLADSLVRLRSHQAAAQIYARLGTSPSSDPVIRWHHFWNTYLSGDYQGALAVLDRAGYVPQRDRGVEGGLDYWRARILDKLGRSKEADEIYKKILATNGETYYAILIQVMRPGMIEASVRTVPPSTYDEGQEIIEEIAVKDAFAAKLVASGINVGNTEGLSGEKLDVGTSRMLQKWGDYRTARRLLRTVRWPNIVANKMFPEVADLAFALGDFGFGLKAATLPDSPFKSVPSATADLFEHMTRNNADWRYVYPMAYERLVTRYADTAKIDPFLLLSLMRAESVYDPDARSHVGAQGLMQIMPFTAIRIARQMNDSRFELGDLHMPEVNIGYAAYYVRRLLNYYSGNIMLAVASYNAGPQAVDRWVSTFANLEMDELVETMSFKETRRYLKTVLRNFNQYKHIYGAKQALTAIPVLPDLPTNQEIY